ncbi:phage head-tail joining protein [Hahella ganghwensis]|uniref:phage head-tail joining protein n=1 Tax=Hahella ganghwensis TaxID=286420 RepID=UPI00036EDC80|nr:hypothetical protein [Hahella ganghwensis]
MAFTTTQLAELEEAYAMGVLTVKHADGRSVTYQSTNQLYRAIQNIRAELSAKNSTTKRPRAIRVRHSKGL